MTQRFGRNQRRRAREALAAQARRIVDLEVALTMDRALLRHTSDKLERCRDEIAEAKEIAGHMSILFPAQTKKLAIEAQETIRDYVDTHLLPLSEYQSMDLQAQYIQTQDLPVLLAKIDRNRLDSAVHMVIEFRGKICGYAISDDALQSRTGEAMLAELKRSLPRVVNVQLFGAR